jgi:uncharacterized protein (DUF2147 family)
MKKILVAVAAMIAVSAFAVTPAAPVTPVTPVAPAQKPAPKLKHKKHAAKKVTKFASRCGPNGCGVGA